MPSAEVVQRAIDIMGRRPENYAYFFDRLTSPDWIEPLGKQGFFRNPPPADRADDLIHFPPWPESRYLARVANKAPSAVLSVAAALPATDNVSVYEDLFDAATRMPAPQAMELADRLAHWVETQDYLYGLVDHKVGALIKHLIELGAPSAALRLLGAALAILPVRGPTEEDQERSWQDFSTRVSEWDYARLLRELVPALTARAGRETVALLTDLLRAAVRSEKGDEDGPTQDYSSVWRPAIEEHEQNRGQGLRGVLVAALRDTAHQLASADPGKCREIIRWIESPPPRVFRRIGLHLRREFADRDREFAKQALLNRDSFLDPWLRHEYTLLLEKLFPVLAAGEQEELLRWAAESFDAAEFRALLLKERGREPTIEEEQAAAELRLRDRLAPIAEHLPSPWRDRYGGIVARRGMSEHADFPVYSTGVMRGPSAPVSSDELARMDDDELLRLLETWQPPDTFMGPSKEGLASELSKLVEREPARFAKLALRFSDQDPTYARALVNGLRNAAKAGDAFDWASVLEACRRIVSHPRSAEDEKVPYDDRDPHWGWARGSVAELLETGFQGGPSEIPAHLRRAAWACLEPITEDANPLPGPEGDEEEPSFDARTDSLNTTRGKAMHALVHYALWVHRPLAPEGKGSTSFEEMPEVRAVLNRHLDTAVEHSLGIRAVYGWRFPWLRFLDRDWAEGNVSRIFPSEDEKRRYWFAAWSAYLFLPQVFDDLLEVLRSEYALAIERLADAHPQVRKRADPDDRLAEHLMVFYWRGLLDLDATDSLLPRFYEAAPDPVRAHAMAFLGRNLCSKDSTPPPEVLERLSALWVHRRSEASRETGSSAEELAAWGWWFASGRFDASWSLDQLEWVLTAVGKADPDHLVVEELARLAPSHTPRVVRCLRLFFEHIRGRTDEWRIHAAEEETKVILSAGLQHGDQIVREEAADLVNYLGARGFRQFRALLSPPEPARH